MDERKLSKNKDLWQRISEEMLVQEIKSLQNEIIRLKQIKIANREYRRVAGLPCKK